MIVFFSASVSAASLPDSLVPVGTVVGISVNAGGVLVSDVSGTDNENGSVSPAKDAGIMPGDIITAVDGQSVIDSRQLIEALSNAEGDTVSISFTRGSENHTVLVSPYRDDGGCYIGIWVRGDMNGIGTVTFYDPETGVYGALGHPICEPGSGELFPVSFGSIVKCELTNPTPGVAGTPGQLNGTLISEQELGSVYLNSSVGIFGSADMAGLCDAIPIAKRSEIKTGPAVILSDLSGTQKEYAIEIVRVYPDSSDGRSMMVKITDSALKETTGGIVQGMSGSPIIQNGKLIGAVTHVLISDPSKGYATSIEEMLSACEAAGLYDSAA